MAFMAGFAHTYPGFRNVSGRDAYGKLKLASAATPFMRGHWWPGSTRIATRICRFAKEALSGSIATSTITGCYGLCRLSGLADPRLLISLEFCVNLDTVSS